MVQIQIMPILQILAALAFLSVFQSLLAVLEVGHY